MELRSNGQSLRSGRWNCSPGWSEAEPGVYKTKNHQSPQSGRENPLKRLRVRLRLITYRDKLCGGLQTAAPPSGARLLFVLLNPGFRFAPPGATILPPALWADEHIQTQRSSSKNDEQNSTFFWLA